jgi:putative FmdB family regulatory protein
MPIYEYRCENGHTFDVRQGFSDDPVTTCQVCGAPVQRVFRPVAVHFKGSGFYNTDYGTRKRSREMKEAAKGEAKSETAGKDGSSSSKSNSSTGSDSSAGSTSSTGSDSGTKKPESKAS